MKFNDLVDSTKMGLLEKHPNLIIILLNLLLFLVNFKIFNDFEGRYKMSLPVPKIGTLEKHVFLIIILLYLLLFLVKFKKHFRRLPLKY